MSLPLIHRCVKYSFFWMQEGQEDDTPRAAGSVHREGLKRIVDLELEEKLGGEGVHQEGAKSNRKEKLSIEPVAAGTGSHQTS